MKFARALTAKSVAGEHVSFFPLHAPPQPANFQPVASTWVPLHAYDARAAWDGTAPAQPDSKIHVEAAVDRMLS